MIKINTLIFILLVSLVGCEKNKQIVIKYSNPEIEYCGRIDNSRAEGAELYWSGTSIKINFEGESIQALMQDETGDNYYNIIIDNNNPILFQPNTTKKYYQLASELSNGKHSIEIFKRTEWDKGKTIFEGFKIIGNPKILPKSAERKKKNRVLWKFYNSWLCC